MSGTLREPRGVLLRMMIQCFFFFFREAIVKQKLKTALPRFAKQMCFFSEI